MGYSEHCCTSGLCPILHNNGCKNRCSNRPASGTPVWYVQRHLLVHRLHQGEELNCTELHPVPGSSQRFLDKSRSLTADCVAYDLEDSVTPSLKDDARKLVRRALDEPRPDGIKERAVRINSVSSGLALADLIEVVSYTTFKFLPDGPWSSRLTAFDSANPPTSPQSSFPKSTPQATSPLSPT